MKTKLTRWNSNLKVSATRLSRSKLRVRSAKKAKSDRVLAKARTVAMQACGGRCEMQWWAARCTQQATQVHHRKARSAGGGHDESNLICVCEVCHRWIHANPVWARVNRFTIPSWQAASIGGAEGSEK